MGKSMRIVLGGIVIVGASLVLTGALSAINAKPLRAAEPAETEPAPPEDQSYIGVKKCASCHFQQFMTWKKTKHSQVFDLLPEKYQQDEKCLECHTTGYGQPTGYKDMETTPSLAGNTCENCHGPGSKHEEVCQAYKNKKLNEEEEKIARDSIWKILPGNVCVKCHTVEAHGEPGTPEELRKKD